MSMRSAVDHVLRLLEDALAGAPWSPDSALARGFNSVEAASRRTLATADFVDDHAWLRLGQDFDAAVARIAAAWGPPSFAAGPSEFDEDFFATPVRFPPSGERKVSAWGVPDGRELPPAERIASWERNGNAAYVSLELWDNTRIRALVAGVCL